MHASVRVRIFRRNLRTCTLALATLLLVSCQSVPLHSGYKTPSLIPMPVAVDATPGAFILHEGAALIVHSSDAKAIGVARQFAELLARTRGLHLDVRLFDAAHHSDDIVFVLDPRLLIPGDRLDEGYELTVGSRRITLAARTPHGLFNGSITLWQWLTQDLARTTTLAVPCVSVRDYPRFAWRGLMLDSARHFQSPEFIKQLLDAMSRLKLDVLHWHLTDDQGWRIPIERYPELTAVGAWRTPSSLRGGAPRYGGFYTQEEIRDIVHYAAARYITIVPEIEMPGHAQAAIAAYPQLGVTGKHPPVSPDWGVHTYLYNVNDSTFTFLENVLTEVMDLFPGPYVHIGGDEAAKDQWRASAQVQRRMRALGISSESALQGYFTARIGKFLAAHGRRLIGWDEILEGGLPPSAVVMSWQGEAGGVAAARQGHDVVMAPSPLMYFDHVQSALHDEPPGRPDAVTLADVYAYEPVPRGLDATQARHMLGAQANLWTEYLDTPQRVEHAAFPRVAALAEVLWSPPARRNWKSFLSRLAEQFARYRTLGIEFADSAFAPDIHAVTGTKPNTARVTISNQANFGEIRYTLNGSAPTPDSPRYTQPLTLPLPTTLRVAVFDHGRALAAAYTRSLSALSLLRRNSDELQSCKPGAGLPLRLPGPAANGGEDVYRVEIFDPCWIYPRVDLDVVRRIDVAAGERPFNFQLWKDADKVVLRKSTSPGGELRVYQDSCSGDALATIPLAGRVDVNGWAQLKVALPVGLGTHDLCFTFDRATASPLWMIDSVQLLPR
ncbi:MAG: family 20 glycosylhydrolase [Rudaea sp.]